jgi:SAM-dependent methyltransferase
MSAFRPAVSRLALRIARKAPLRVKVLGRKVLSGRRPSRPPSRRLDYQELYTRHAALSDDDAFLVGGTDSSDFDRVGRIELAVLLESGLARDATLVDLGCGTGRLAVQAVRWLEGEYIGIDIAQKMLDIAQRRLDVLAGETRCSVRLINSGATSFPVPDRSVDLICAFSVFTHMEHEDSYRYLVDAHRVVKEDGLFVYSCLPLDFTFAKEIFRESASIPLHDRWSRVRNVVTSRDFMEELCALAGWQTERWYGAEERRWLSPGSNEEAALGQAVAVLRRASG